MLIMLLQLIERPNETGWKTGHPLPQGRIRDYSMTESCSH